VEKPSIVENLEWSILLFRLFNLQNSGIPRNSGKILTDGGVHYNEVLLCYIFHGCLPVICTAKISWNIYTTVTQPSPISGNHLFICLFELMPSWRKESGCFASCQGLALTVTPSSTALTKKYISLLHKPCWNRVTLSQDYMP